MASPPPPKAKGSSRWGSLLSGAVAGLESRLDTILAEDNEASARSRTQDREKPATLAVPAPKAPAADLSRSSSRAKKNDRLQERLAKALASQTPSRPSTPLTQTTSPRSSLGSRPSADIVRPASTSLPEKQEDASGTTQVPVIAEPTLEPSVPEPSATLLTSGLPINPARISEDARDRPSLDTESTTLVEETTHQVDASEPEIAIRPEPEAAQNHSEDAETERLRQEEMLTYLERIDALQAKLQYLAKETVAAAKEVNASAPQGSLQQKLAEKDERIALLMQEGEKLSKTEMRHMTTIKKMRVKSLDDDKSLATLNKQLAQIRDSESDLRQKVRRLEQAEKLNAERMRRFATLERELESERSISASSNASVASLRKQLAEAERKAEEAEIKAKETVVQADTNKLSFVQEQLEDVKLEKKLADDRWAAENRRLTEENQRQKQQATFRETELTTEISTLESRLEALRSRAEEATSDMGGDSHAKLLRQIETLQTQYSLAAENWRTIESSLNGRITAIERERDEATKREADIRKKARDISNKAKRTDEELEQATEEVQIVTSQLEDNRVEMKKLQSRLDAAEASLEGAKADFDRQKLAFEEELGQKLEEERARHIQEGLGISSPSLASRTQSPTSFFKKQSYQDPYGSMASRRNLPRISSQEQTPTLSVDRSVSRRPSALTHTMSSSRAPLMVDTLSPSVSRQGSVFSLSHLMNGSTAGGMPGTPSIHTNDMDADEFDDRSSPQQTINDVISASTVHTGPSVQLVERMSSSIRRLEAEKAAHKDELSRLATQRDEARDEVVALMREVETKRNADGKTEKLEAELAQVKQRYEACLDILGEREEQVEELKSDVIELKKIYRDLAERSL